MCVAGVNRQKRGESLDMIFQRSSRVAYERGYGDLIYLQLHDYKMDKHTQSSQKIMSEAGLELFLQEHIFKSNKNWALTDQSQRLTLGGPMIMPFQ